MNKRIFPLVVGASILLTTQSFAEDIKVPYPQGVDPLKIIQGNPDLYRYTHYNIDDANNVIIYHEDMPTQKQVDWVLNKLKKRDIDTLNAFFKNTFYYPKEATITTSKIDTLLTKKQGLCRPVALLYAECVTQMGYRTKLILTNNLNTNKRHVLVAVQKDGDELYTLTDPSNIVQYKGDISRFVNQSQGYLLLTNQEAVYQGDLNDIKE